MFREIFKFQKISSKTCPRQLCFGSVGYYEQYINKYIPLNQH